MPCVTTAQCVRLPVFSSGAALERAAARVCREAGARVATNVLLRDMNIDVPPADGRRAEVLANGLPLWQGAYNGPRNRKISKPGRSPRKTETLNKKAKSIPARSKRLIETIKGASPDRIRKRSAHTQTVMKEDPISERNKWIPTPEKK